MVAFVPADTPFRLLFVPGLLDSALFAPVCALEFVVGALAYGCDVPPLALPIVPGLLIVPPDGAPAVLVELVPAEPVPPPAPPAPCANANAVGAANRVAAKVAYLIVLSTMIIPFPSSAAATH